MLLSLVNTPISLFKHIQLTVISIFYKIKMNQLCVLILLTTVPFNNINHAQSHCYGGRKQPGITARNMWPHFPQCLWLFWSPRPCHLHHRLTRLPSRESRGMFLGLGDGQHLALLQGHPGGLSSILKICHYSLYKDQKYS